MGTTTAQEPIGSPFNRDSTAREVVGKADLSGKNFIVTGGYSGIGIESVRALADAGATVTVPARSKARAEAALGGLPGDIEIAEMDLSDLESVRKFAREYAGTGRKLQSLINNAGVMACPLSRVGNDWELQFATCHIGHFELTLGLEVNLKKAQGARVIALSSSAHAVSDVHWDDPNFHSHDYEKWSAYGQAKSANALFALGLDQRWQDDGVRGFSVHPGGIFTPLQRHLTDEEMVAFGWKNADGTIPELIKAMFKSPEQGGATALWCALSPQLEGMGGVYCEDCDISCAASDSSPVWQDARPYICDLEKATRLWRDTEAMIASA